MHYYTCQNCGLRHGITECGSLAFDGLFCDECGSPHLIYEPHELFYNMEEISNNQSNPNTGAMKMETRKVKNPNKTYGCDDCKYHRNHHCKLWQIKVNDPHDSHCVSLQYSLCLGYDNRS